MVKHTQHKVQPRLMIVTGEASGDLHGGALAEALFSKNREIEIVGFGGKAMQTAGVDIQFDIKHLGIVGIIEVFFHFRVILKAFRKAVALLDQGLDLLIVIDFSGFNLRLAKAAKERGIPVVYYISPQVWAWRAGRIGAIAERVEKILVILPFEKAIYDAAKVSCEFVGHPLLDELAVFKKDHAFPIYRKQVGQSPVIALLPGSRTREVNTILPEMLESVRKLLPDFPGLTVMIPMASSLSESLIPDLVKDTPFPVSLKKGSIYEVLFKADLAVVASGTATLQGAMAGTPMVVVYKVSFLSYWIAKLMVKLKAVSLVNIVADEPFVPELIQGECTSERIAQEVDRLLKDSMARQAMHENLLTVALKLGRPGASARAASAILKLLNQRQQCKQTQQAKVSEGRVVA